MNYEMLREIFVAKRKAFLFLAFLFALNLALAAYLSFWQRPRVAAVQNEWFAKREALKSGQSVTAATSYRNSLADLAAFDKRILAKREFPAFISHLYESAGKNALVIKTITYKPSVVKEAEGMVSYGISFNVSGKYGAIKNFIADFSRYPEIVTLDELSLSSESQTEESVNLKVQMTAYLKTEGA